tara:strand:+ start:23 stop:616 length:594 start_codon:yes stop_codon:yes gene_type:complete
MKEVIFFSKNEGKSLEILNLFKKEKIKIINLNDLEKVRSPKENGVSFEENAKIKSSYGLKYFMLACFADDSGICINAMNGKPGINSKNFLEKHKDPNFVFNKIFNVVKKNKNNKAFFKTSICLSLEKNKNIYFNGIIKGTITDSPRGKGGFGYDPIFIPNGYNRTFAEMTTKEKNVISHRSIAINKLKKYLTSLSLL